MALTATAAYFNIKRRHISTEAVIVHATIPSWTHHCYAILLLLGENCRKTWKVNAMHEIKYTKDDIKCLIGECHGEVTLVTHVPVARDEDLYCA